MVKTKQEVTTSADDGQSASNSFRQLHAKKKKLQGQCLPRKNITNCILGHSMLSKFEVDVDINGL